MERRRIDPRWFGAGAAVLGSAAERWPWFSPKR